ncbi:hypothetical protein KUTeg_019512 [Tegillarca granosa]|uniref:Uncharacterized protein n=1 Tax=Tegillarca granosa TaxID=220873 RepID=A0ABQ9EGZ5_TEGGR|nr:hypothetical protein KUTeg_019512 [Tegillarca granosa]
MDLTIVISGVKDSATCIYHVNFNDIKSNILIVRFEAMYIDNSVDKGSNNVVPYITVYLYCFNYALLYLMCA